MIAEVTGVTIGTFLSDCVWKQFHIHVIIMRKKIMKGIPVPTLHPMITHLAVITSFLLETLFSYVDPPYIERNNMALISTHTLRDSQKHGACFVQS